MEYCGGGICESQRRVYARVKRVGETLPHGNNAKGGVKSLPFLGRWINVFHKIIHFLV